MNESELRFFTQCEKQFPDCTTLPVTYLLKCGFIKARRRLFTRRVYAVDRLAWTVPMVSDADGPAGNVRNYLEQRTIRAILTEFTGGRRLARACEIGCGYGRVTMVLKEFADFVKGFEREPHLVEMGRQLLPGIAFECVSSLTCLQDEEPYEIVMTCSVLQHLTDSEVAEVCNVAKRLAPRGHVLCIEKTQAISTTENVKDGSRFISRARSIATYEALMRPFTLVATRERLIEPTYFNAHPGTCMVFASPARQRESVPSHIPSTS